MMKKMMTRRKVGTFLLRRRTNQKRVEMMTELPRVRVIGSWRRAFTIVVLCASVANISWNVAKMEDDDAYRMMRQERDRLQLFANSPAPQFDYRLGWSLGRRDGRCSCTIDSVCGTKSNHIDLVENLPPYVQHRDYPFTLLMPDGSNPSCPPGHLSIGDDGKVRCE